MIFLLKISRLIDRLNTWVGRSVIWLILASTGISALNAVVRKVLGVSSNAWLEVQWFLYAAAFLLAAGYTLLQNEHVRVDVLASRLPRRPQAWIELFGLAFFLAPMAALVLWLSLPAMLQSIASGETSGSAGGLPLWPVYLMIPLGFCLLLLQGASQGIKYLAFLLGRADDPGKKATGGNGQDSGRNNGQEG